MLNIITFFNKYKSNIIEHIQDISVLCIGITTLFSCLYYNLAPLYYGNDKNYDLTKPFEMLIPVIGIRTIIDIFFLKSLDLKLHHLCILSILFNYYYYYNASKENIFLFLYPLIKTEISSIFLVLKNWLPKNTFIYNLNLIFGSLYQI